MPNVTLTFNHEINASVQVGDVAYYVGTKQVGLNQQPPYISPSFPQTPPHDSADRKDVKEIGPIISLSSSFSSSIIVCDMSAAASALYGPPLPEDFIMFSKDNRVNLGSLTGYYSNVKFRNSSKEEAELFSIGSDFSESSK